MLFALWKRLARRVTWAAYAVGLATCLTNAAGAQTTTTPCENSPTQLWLPTTSDPAPLDERAVRKLISIYNWALDDHLPAQLDGLFTDDVFYELCNAADEQITKKTGEQQLKIYLNEYFDEFVGNGTQARHVESNTLLHLVDANTVQGKSTIIVTLQHSDVEMPVIDYTGVLRTEFKKEGNLWLFSRITLITDGPRLTLRAR